MRNDAWLRVKDMKKLLYFSVTVLLFLAMVQPALAGPLNVKPAQVNPPPSSPDGLEHPIYLPAIMSPLITYTVSGQIKDANDKPLSGVSVSVLSDSLLPESAQQTVTDANGVYSLIPPLPGST
jgi:hypothetical protein